MVRLANLDESLSIAKLIKEYVQTLDIKAAKQSFSLRKTTSLVQSCITQGLCWVSLKEDQIVGSLFAQEQFNMFSDKDKEIHLIGLYVKPEYRNSTSGGRLLIEFDREAQQRDIKITWVSLQHTSTIKNQSLQKLGYEVSEITYKKEK